MHMMKSIFLEIGIMHRLLLFNTTMPSGTQTHRQMECSSSILKLCVCPGTPLAMICPVSFLAPIRQTQHWRHTSARTHMHTHTHTQRENGINHVCSRHTLRNRHFPLHLSLVVLSQWLHSHFPLGLASCRLRNASTTPVPQCWRY